MIEEHGTGANHIVKTINTFLEAERKAKFL